MSPGTHRLHSVAVGCSEVLGSENLPIAWHRLDASYKGQPSFPTRMIHDTSRHFNFMVMVRVASVAEGGV